ncbi:MAG: hypothetical protein K0R27_315 [Xanthobacteraceae bacterium]|jgi:hypothetical protein|nr:hypothetical protein [Xanthobacteraceae bacterium]
MMANPHRGQTPLTVGENTYLLSLSMNAMCSLEAHLNLPIFKILLELDVIEKNPLNMRLSLLRSVLWAMLQDHQPAAGIRDAGDILEVAGLEEASKAIMVASTIAMPMLSPTAARSRAARPPEAGG